ncbi:MAG: protein jag [Oscillospiraceae bacterium]|nr:protein jag [Oscillospiraceae bacterium]
MLKWIESTGRNEEAAIEAALSQLGLERDAVTVELLERAKTGFLGIGSVPARVKVSYEAADEAVKPAGTATASKPPRPSAQQAPAAPPEREMGAGPDGDVETHIATFIADLLTHMGAQAEVQVELDAEGRYQVVLLGKDLGGLIGRRGETLDAIQQLTSYAVNRNRDKRVRVFLDAENYRARREASLIRLANKTAEKAAHLRREITLEPMNAYERHIIHTALQDMPGIKTFSVGAEPNRRTVVAFERTTSGAKQ